MARVRRQDLREIERAGRPGQHLERAAFPKGPDRRRDREAREVREDRSPDAGLVSLGNATRPAMLPEVTTCPRRDRARPRARQSCDRRRCAAASRIRSRGGRIAAAARPRVFTMRSIREAMSSGLSTSLSLMSTTPMPRPIFGSRSRKHVQLVVAAPRELQDEMIGAQRVEERDQVAPETAQHRLAAVVAEADVHRLLVQHPVQDVVDRLGRPLRVLRKARRCLPRRAARCRLRPARAAAAARRRGPSRGPAGRGSTCCSTAARACAGRCT